MALTFIAKDPGSQPQGSPTLYRTDRGSWIVQGWAVTDPDELAQITTSTDPADIALCSSAFEAVWPLAIPHNDYKPA